MGVGLTPPTNNAKEVALPLNPELISSIIR
jgi:hypothetical protein